MNSTEYIIQQRIKDYEDDIKCCEEFNADVEVPRDLDRISQNRAIIRELERILYGKELDTIG